MEEVEWAASLLPAVFLLLPHPAWAYVMWLLPEPEHRAVCQRCPGLGLVYPNHLSPCTSAMKIMPFATYSSP